MIPPQLQKDRGGVMQYLFLGVALILGFIGAIIIPDFHTVLGVYLIIWGAMLAAKAGTM